MGYLRPPRQTFITKKNWDYYERHCRGKIKHRALWSVFDHVTSLQKKEPDAVFAWYICNFCTCMHVGHDKNAPANRQRVEKGEINAAGKGQANLQGSRSSGPVLQRHNVEPREGLALDGKGH